jgi:uncharacterized delta-60 repeat protein
MKNTHFFLSGLIAIVLLPFTAFSAGIIDQTFGTNGTLNLNFGNQTNIVDVETKADGKIVVAGTIANSTSGKDIVVAQFNANGTRDTNFGINGVTISVTSLDETITDLEIGADGKIVLVGQRQAYEGVNGVFDFLVVRYSTNGLLDGAFGNNGFVTVNQNQADNFNKLTIQNDGKIVAIGTTIEVVFQRIVARFNPNGTRDSTFASGGFWSEELADSTPFFDIEALSEDKFAVVYGSLRRLNADQDEYKLFVDTFNSDGRANSTFVRVTTIVGLPGTLRTEVEKLPNGYILIISKLGIHYFDAVANSINGGGRLLPFEPYLGVFANGSFVISKDTMPQTLLYSSRSFIGSAVNLPTGKIATMDNSRFVILSANSLTGVRNLTSDATRIGLNDGDGKTDFVVDRRSINSVYILRTPTTFNLFSPLVVSNRTMLPERGILGGYVYRSGNTFFQQSGSNITLGTADNMAVGGDFDGNMTADFGVFTSNGDWLIQATPTNRFFHWGTTGDKPVPADYDYDGITDYAVYRPSTGIWWIHRSSNDSSFGIQFGLPTDIPLTGDYDADGKADLAVYRPSNGFWYLLMTTDGFKAVQFGLATDIPVPGDYDGDGKHDIGVFRNGIWYLLQSRDGFTAIQWGQAGDVPVTVRYDN